MKKTIYISGIIIINLLLVGCIFKINHWPGAGIFLTISIVSLCFWFIPASLISNYTKREVKDKKWLYIAAFITFFVVFMGALFKVQHWPGASYLLLIGVPIPFILFLPIYLYHNIRDKEKSPTNFIGIILGLTFIAVYSVLLAINVSKNVLDHGISLIKSNESIIDFYEMVEEDLSATYNENSKTIVDMNKLSFKCDEICHLINEAEKQLLTYSGNESIAGDMGNAAFNVYSVQNKENAFAQYLLHWRENALSHEIKGKIIDLEQYLNSLDLNQNLAKTIDGIFVMEDVVIESSLISWELREFSSDYMIFALESLSRWEKNIRFVENEVLAELLQIEE